MHVSVVIPALNEEAAIGRCLESLTAQMADGDEVLLLDNGSTDETAAIARSFDGVTVYDVPDSRLDDDGHLRGLAQLRQFGAERASNPIVATTDADSIPPAGWLDRIKAHFDADPDLSVVWGVVTDRNGVPVRNLTGSYLTFVGGVSGANTAFRRADFEQLRKGYVGWPMFEDVALISRLARTGKAKHDTDLVMISDLDRRRYQSIPILASAGTGVAAGALIGGPAGAFAAGSGVGLGGTELVYEAAPSTDFHHDQLGLVAVLAGMALSGSVGMGVAGVGTGLLAHHVLTEGLSGLPTPLMQSTDAVCEVPQQREGETVITEIDCEPKAAGTTKLTRVLGGLALGAVAGRGLAALNA